ncbi:MAG: LLM class flavin-dependent oxidoreductase [Acidimicrobiia bacterium]
MEFDLLLDPFGARWHELREAAVAAEAAGVGGLWLWDHVAGSVHRSAGVVESWTVLSALAAVTERLMLGPMVLNAATRDPVVLAAMAATFQDVSGGRLLLGIGAGGGPGTPYAAELRAMGQPVAADAARRRRVEDVVTTLQSVWSGSHGGASGFLVPNPAPPVIIGGFGPKMAALAGRVGDGINVPASALGLVEVARAAHVDAGRDPAHFVVTASVPFSPRPLQQAQASGVVDRAVCYVKSADALAAIEAIGPLLT